MIILDTNIWIWWVQGDPRLLPIYLNFIQQNEAAGIGVSAISCWEVAKLVERGRLALPISVGPWLTQALAYPGVRLLPLSPEVSIEATQLPGTFHRDPADQIIVATARLYDSPLVTVDQAIRAYLHVQVAPSLKGDVSA